MSGGTNGYYAAVYPEFWTGPTGRAIRQAGRDTQVLALYLISNRYATMIGLYRLLFDDAIVETGITKTALGRAFANLERVEFATYDASTEHVWVREMAKYRLGLHRQPLKAADNRATGAQRLYAQLDDNPFLGEFFKRYAKELHIKKKRSSSLRRAAPQDVALPRGSRPPHKALGRDSEGATKPLASPLQGPCKPVQITGTGTGTDRNRTSTPRTSVPGVRQIRSTDAFASELTQPVENQTPGGGHARNPLAFAVCDRHEDASAGRRQLQRVGRADQGPHRAGGRGDAEAGGPHPRDESRDRRAGETIATAADGGAPARAEAARGSAPTPGGAPVETGPPRRPVDVDARDPPEPDARAQFRRTLAAVAAFDRARAVGGRSG